MYCRSPAFSGTGLCMEYIYESRAKRPTLCKIASLRSLNDTEGGVAPCASGHTADTAAQPRQRCQLEMQANSICTKIPIPWTCRSAVVHAQRHRHLRDRQYDRAGALPCRSVSTGNLQSVPAVGASQEQANEQLTHLLGSIEHHDAFLRAWHSRIQQSIHLGTAAASALQNADTHQEHLHAVDRQMLDGSTQARCSARASSSAVTQLGGMLHAPQVVYRRWSPSSPPALHTGTVSRAQCATTSSNAAVSSLLLLSRQHAAVSSPVGPHAASVSVAADAGHRQRVLTQAAQQWLQEQHAVHASHQQQPSSPPPASARLSSSQSTQQGAHMQDPPWQPASGAGTARVSADHLHTRSTTQQGTDFSIFFAGATSSYWQHPAAQLSSSSPAPQYSHEHLAALATESINRCTVQCSRKAAEVCPICLDDMAVNELAPLLMCGHRTHGICLQRWVTHWLAGQAVASREPVVQPMVICPVCKQTSVDRQKLAVVEAE